MKQTIWLKPLCFVMVCCLLLFSSWSARSASERESYDRGFGIKEFEEFHEVLHPLEHEALPKGDFKRIRANGTELVKRGHAILKLGVPSNLEKKKVNEYKEWLGKFGEALGKFKTDCDEGTDVQLKESYSSVHDSFEMLAALLPRG